MHWSAPTCLVVVVVVVVVVVEVAAVVVVVVVVIVVMVVVVIVGVRKMLQSLYLPPLPTYRLLPTDHYLPISRRPESGRQIKVAQRTMMRERFPRKAAPVHSSSTTGTVSPMMIKSVCTRYMLI